MKKNLSFRESLVLTSMLFGMFFGAGNLIFPAQLGVSAGRNLWAAYAGLIITAVGLPLLAVAALAFSASDGLLALSCKVGRRYGLFFTTLLYLTIGPLFAIPRCASTSFSIGATTLVPAAYRTLAQALFSLAFFVLVLLFSLKPRGIMTWIGTILNPLFLALLAILVLAVFLRPLNTMDAVSPTAAYATGDAAFFSGFLEGYNTLDALAGLAFGIVVVTAVREHGVSQPHRIAVNTAKAGLFSCLFMGVIYWFVAMIAVQCGTLVSGSENGSVVLATIADNYFHSAGTLLLLAIVTLACLKTAIGLVTSCSEAFVRIFPHGPAYRTWAILFCIVSFAIANFGLSTIVTFCVPILMFLYPLAITLIFLALFERTFGKAQCVYRWVTGFTLVAALFDFANALAAALASMQLSAVPLLDALIAFATHYLPFFSYGLGWVCPALLGCCIGLVHRCLHKAHNTV